MTQFEIQNLTRLSETNEAAQILIEDYKDTIAQNTVRSIVWSLFDKHKGDHVKVKESLKADVETYKGLGMIDFVNKCYTDCITKNRLYRKNWNNDTKRN